MFDMRFACFKLDLLSRLLPREVLPLVLVPLRLVFFLIVLGGLVGFFGVVGRGDLENRVNEEAEVGLLMADPEVEILVDLVEGLGVDALGEVGVLLCPVFKDGLESRANSGGLFEEVFAVLVEEELEAVGDEHEVEDEVFVLGLVAGDANNIPDLLGVLSDEAVLDVPVGLLDHVGEENGLDLVHEEDLGDGLEHLVDRVPECDVAATGH